MSKHLTSNRYQKVNLTECSTLLTRSGHFLRRKSMQVESLKTSDSNSYLLSYTIYHFAFLSIERAILNDLSYLPLITYYFKSLYKENPRPYLALGLEVSKKKSYTNT